MFQLNWSEIEHEPDTSFDVLGRTWSPSQAGLGLVPAWHGFTTKPAFHSGRCMAWDSPRGDFLLPCCARSSKHLAERSDKNMTEALATRWGNDAVCTCVWAPRPHYPFNAHQAHADCRWDRQAEMHA